MRIEDIKMPLPVLYIHKGEKERLIAVLVDADWLDKVYRAAWKGGFKDKCATKAGRKEGFMPHEHLLLDEDENIVDQGSNIE